MARNVSKSRRTIGASSAARARTNSVKIKRKSGTPVVRPDWLGEIELGPLFPFPWFQDHIRNLFEGSRPGRPVIRSEDLVALRIETRNLDIVPGPQPRLKKSRGGAAYLILHFPPQSFAEETFFEQTADPSQSEELRPPPVRARIANESRLVFTCLLYTSPEPTRH